MGEEKEFIEDIEKPALAVQKRLSPSAINSYYKCPREYYYTYIGKLKTKPSIHLVKGSIVHKTLEDFFKRFNQGENKELLLIVKTDVHGSLEPVVNSLEDLASDEVKVRILHADVGNITENDVNLAGASHAVIIGFNTSADNAAERVASSTGVDIRTYEIIYKMVEDVEKALKGMLDPVYEDKVIGMAEVRQIFNISRVGQIAGCYVRTGTIRRKSKARVVRRGKIIADGLNIGNLKHLKDDVQEVRQGFECGVSLDRFNDFQEGDQIEFLVKERVN